MPRDGPITPADLVGKLDWLNVRCEKCGRADTVVSAGSPSSTAATAS
jgi:hypothetical protein